MHLISNAKYVLKHDLYIGKALNVLDNTLNRSLFVTHYQTRIRVKPTTDIVFLLRSVKCISLVISI